MRAAAPPPTALKSDTSCGIAVIFTVRAVYRPSPPPTAMPAAMMTQPMPPAWRPLTARSTAVPPMAMAMPPALTRLPLRAVAGELIRMSPMTNAAAPTSQARRTMASRGSMSGLRLVRRLRGRRPAAEHLQHPVGDDIAAHDVHRRECDGNEAEDLAERLGRGGRDEHRAHEDDPVDGV